MRQNHAPPQRPSCPSSPLDASSCSHGTCVPRAPASTETPASPQATSRRMLASSLLPLLWSSCCCAPARACFPPSSASASTNPSVLMAERLAAGQRRGHSRPRAPGAGASLPATVCMQYRAGAAACCCRYRGARRRSSASGSTLPSHAYSPDTVAPSMLATSNATSLPSPLSLRCTEGA